MKKIMLTVISLIFLIGLIIIHEEGMVNNLDILAFQDGKSVLTFNFKNPNDAKAECSVYFLVGETDGILNLGIFNPKEEKNIEIPLIMKNGNSRITVVPKCSCKP